MPGLIGEDGNARKRKRDIGKATSNGVSSSRKAPKTSANKDGMQAQILQLEEQVLESREYYNNITTLQQLAANFTKKPKTASLAAIALCRIFCRFIASEKLVQIQQHDEADAQITRWLKQRLRDYVGELLGWIGSPDAVRENTALALIMKIVKEETMQESKRAEQAWRTEQSTFYLLVKTLVEKTGAEGARQGFVEEFVEEYDDVRFYTMLAVKQFFSAKADITEDSVTNALDLLKRIEGIPSSEEQLEDWYGRIPKPESHQLYSLSTHRKTAQECWLCIFRSRLTTGHRKTILRITTPQVLPWFSNRIEILTDFLTDSFNTGGSTSLVALSGIFHLITKRNLDYPDFYPKLYSLLDEDLMHSAHRTRVFKLLDQALNSSHLPAAMVASFIKRLARLSLQAPPGAIVWIVPWVYNTMKQHPSCTFMLHRPHHPAHLIYSLHPNYNDEGTADPFDATEADPNVTAAIDSSLWELHTLQDHWHPNVATLAKILGEQFTKREYSLLDFEGYGYAALIDAELGKVVKKVSEVEWEIPKSIFTEEGGGLNRLGGLLEKAVAAS